MKKIFFVISILTVFMMGCVNAGKIETAETDEAETERETDLSESYDWDHAMIKCIYDNPDFGTGAVVQNDKYIFYPKDGNKVIRVDKDSKEEKTIYEFTPSKEDGIGVHLCLGEDNIFFEYEGNIFSSDYDGSKAVKILSNRKLKKAISKETADIENFCEIRAIYSYHKNIYFISRVDIYEYNLATKEITLLGESSGTVCFCDNELYYESYSSTVIYKVNLSTHKRKRVRGKETNIAKVKNPDTIKYYAAVMEVDNQLYYVRRQNEKSPVIYQYSEEGEDKEIYKFEMRPELVLGIYVDSTKIVCNYHTDSTLEHSKLMIYDVKSGVLNEVDVPGDYISFDFMIGDKVFYADDTSDYLSYFVMNQ